MGRSREKRTSTWTRNEWFLSGHDCNLYRADVFYIHCNDSCICSRLCSSSRQLKYNTTFIFLNKNEEKVFTDTRYFFFCFKREIGKRWERKKKSDRKGKKCRLSPQRIWDLLCQLHVLACYVDVGRGRVRDENGWWHRSRTTHCGGRLLLPECVIVPLEPHGPVPVLLDEAEQDTDHRHEDSIHGRAGVGGGVRSCKRSGWARRWRRGRRGRRRGARGAGGARLALVHASHWRGRAGPTPKSITC